MKITQLFTVTKSRFYLYITKLRKWRCRVIATPLSRCYITVTIDTITFYELTADTTRTLIGQKGKKPMFYCTGKLPLPDKAVLHSTTRKDE